MARRTILGWNLLAPLVALMLLLLDKPAWALGMLALAHALWLWATLVPRCEWWGPVTKSLPQSCPDTVWLTIDDGPDPHDTPELLKLLEGAGAKATFFLIGEKALRHPALVSAIVAAGHGVGNHTQHHRAGVFWALPAQKIRREIEACQESLAKHGATNVMWFRAPAGMRNHAVHPVLQRLGLRLAGWSVRGFDGVSANAEKVSAYLRAGLRPGAVVLMHEGRVADDGQRLAPRVLASLLADLEQRGLRAALPGE